MLFVYIFNAFYLCVHFTVFTCHTTSWNWFQATQLCRYYSMCKITWTCNISIYQLLQGNTSFLWSGANIAYVQALPFFGLLLEFWIMLNSSYLLPPFCQNQFLLPITYRLSWYPVLPQCQVPQFSQHMGCRGEDRTEVIAIVCNSNSLKLLCPMNSLSLKR